MPASKRSSSRPCVSLGYRTTVYRRGVPATRSVLSGRPSTNARTCPEPARTRKTSFARKSSRSRAWRSATARDGSLEAAVRARAVRSLSIAPLAQVLETLAELIEPRQPHEVQLAALAALGEYDDPAVPAALLASFDGLSPRLRNEALETLLSRPGWTGALLDAIWASD